MKKIFGPLLIVLLYLSCTNVATGVDEDYFIPYTDNYGYEYDPETGTYIKKQPSPTDSVTQQQNSTHASNISAAEPAASATGPAEPSAGDSSLGLPLLLAAVILLGGGVMVYVRRQKQQ